MRYSKHVILLTLAVMLLFYSMSCVAQLSYVDGTGKTVLDQVVDQFVLHAKTWQTLIQAAATRLFWSLVLVSMIWTFGMMIMRKADAGEFLAEFSRFIIFTGFFFWLLSNAVSGHNIAGTILSSMQVLGNNASGLGGGSDYVAIMDVGYAILSQTISSLTVLQPVDSIVSFVLGLIIALVLTVIAVNMLLLLVAGWILMYAGIFFLGFGGARWTSDIAINYFKTVLGLGIQLLAMILIIGIGNSFLTNLHSSMSSTILGYEELSVMVIAAITLLILSSRLPALLSGIITGTHIGSAGQGSFGGASVFSAGAAAGGAAVAGLGMAAHKLGQAGTMLAGLAMSRGPNSGGIEGAVKSQTSAPDGFKPPSDSSMQSPFGNPTNTAPLSKDDKPASK